MKKGIRKLIVILLCTACACFLCGASAPFTQPAKLKSPSVRLIDLGAMVKDSAPGQGGNREASEEGESEVKDGTKEGDGAGTVKKEEKKELTVTVQDDRIYLNGEKMKDANALKVRLKTTYKDTLSGKLVDDYASFKTYTEVRQVLKDAGIVPEEERKS